jgi:hypothetical protein
VVSRGLPTAAARVRGRVCSSGICGGQSGAGKCFPRVFRCPLPIFIPPNSSSSGSPGASIMGQKWLTCCLDPVWTHPPLCELKNAEKPKYMLLSLNQNAGQYHDKICIRYFESVSQFKHLGRTVTNQNLIQEEIKRRLNSGNAYYYSIQNLCLIVCCIKT